MPTFRIPTLQPGDIIAFEGTGFLSNAIGFFTNSCISHVAMVWDGIYTCTTITESTIYDKKDGPQFNSLATRLGDYDSKGRAWALRLAPDIRKLLNFDAMWALAAKKVGKDRYNKTELVEYIFRDLPITHFLPELYKANLNREVCSEWATELLSAGGLPNLDPPTTSPQKLAEMRIYSDCVQMMGTPRAIKRFNTR
jgi:hypothetical protein